MDKNIKASIRFTNIIKSFQKTKRLKVLIFKSLPLMTSTFLILLYYNLDTILIKHYLGYCEVGQYNAAYKIIFAFIVVRSIFVSVIFPRMSKEKQAWSEDRLFLTIGLAVAVSIGMIAYLFGHAILNIAYGGKYDSSYVVFLLLSITASVLWVNLFFPTFFIAIRQDMFYMKVHILTALSNLIGNMILIPRYGIEGAAIATLIADVLSLMIFGYFYYRSKLEYRIQ